MKLQKCALPDCKEKFEPRGKGPTAKKYCSDAHKFAFRDMQSREKRAAEKANWPMAVCAREGCEVEFRQEILGTGKPKNTFCSRRCNELGRLTQQREARRALVGPDPDTGRPLSNADLIREMHSRGYFVTKQPLKSGERFSVDLSMFEGDVVKFGVVSDSHMCSRQQQLSHLRSFYRLCSELEIDTVLHAGDMCEGDGKQHKGQEYDLFVHGADEQRDYIVEHYPRETGISTYFIAGSHDYSFWKSAGYDIGQAIAEKRDDLNYLGFFDAYVDIAPGVDINLHHPGGGTAYALSYNAQKKVESYPPELKPRIAIYGHYHRVLWMPAYRNCDTFLTPCFQSQTTFLKEKKIYPVTGGWIMEATVNEDGLANLKPECIRFYVPVENDY